MGPQQKTQAKALSRNQVKTSLPPSIERQKWTRRGVRSLGNVRTGGYLKTEFSDQREGMPGGEGEGKKELRNTLRSA